MSVLTRLDYRLLGLVTVASVLIRVVLLSRAGSLVGIDGAQYMALAHAIASRDLSGYNGMRTPGYPFLLAILERNVSAIQITQLIMGVCTALMTYVIIRLATGQASYAFFGGMLCTLTPSIFTYEVNVLTEATTTFLCTLACLCLVLCLHPSHRHRRLWLVSLAAVCGILPLVRPNLLFLPVLVVAGLLVSALLHSRHRQMGLVIVCLALSVAPVLAWSTVNLRATGYFGLSTALGYNLTNHTGAFIDDAPSKYHDIRTIYLDERQTHVWSDAFLSRFHLATNQINVIWEPGVIPAMMRSTGLDFDELSRRLVGMDLGLIASHPLLYSQQVLAASPYFFLGVGHGGVPNVSSIWPHGMPLGVRVWWSLARLMTAVLAFGALFVVPTLVVVRRLRASTAPWIAWFLAWSWTALVLASLVQAAIEFGDANRFGVPLAPSSIAVGVTAVAALWQALRRRAQARVVGQAQPGRSARPGGRSE